MRYVLIMVLIYLSIFYAAPMLDALATGVKECRTRRFVGKHLQLDDFLDNMLQSRISRRVIAEHLIRLEERR